MPIVPPAPPTTPTSNQVTLQSAPPTSQKNLRKMLGEVVQWNPDANPMIVTEWINNAYRRVIDSRSWYGLLVRAQAVVPQVYTTGVVTVTQGNATVTGANTNWDSTMVGRTFRVGRTTYGPNIVLRVDSPTQMVLDMPWGFRSFTSVGYGLYGNIVSLGANVKYVKSAYNPQVGWRLWVNMPQEVINVEDPWRGAIGQPWALASFVASAAGGPQFELYPMPLQTQAIPALVYIQPPDLTKDGDTPYTFIRSDILVNFAISDALTFRGPKQNKYYDQVEAQRREKIAQVELNKMSMTDDNLALSDLVWEFRKYPPAAPGMDWSQSHSLSAQEF